LGGAVTRTRKIDDHLFDVDRKEDPEGGAPVGGRDALVLQQLHLLFRRPDHEGERSPLAQLAQHLPVALAHLRLQPFVLEHPLEHVLHLLDVPHHGVEVEQRPQAEELHPRRDPVPHGGLEALRRLPDLAQVAIDLGTAQVAHAVLGVEVDDPLGVHARKSGVLLLLLLVVGVPEVGHVDAAEPPAGLGGVLLLEAPLVPLPRLVELALHAGVAAHVEHRVDEEGVQVEGLADEPLRLPVVALALRKIAELPVGRGESRPDLEGALELGAGLPVPLDVDEQAGVDVGVDRGLAGRALLRRLPRVHLDQVLRLHLARLHQLGVLLELPAVGLDVLPPDQGVVPRLPLVRLGPRDGDDREEGEQGQGAGADHHDDFSVRASRSSKKPG
jgi:hypothetical protein